MAQLRRGAVRRALAVTVYLVGSRSGSAATAPLARALPPRPTAGPLAPACPSATARDFTTPPRKDERTRRLPGSPPPGWQGRISRGDGASRVPVDHPAV